MWKGYQNKTSTVTGRKERKRSENKKKYCRLPKTNTCRLTKWFSMFALSRLAKRNSMLPRHALTCCQDVGFKKQAEHEEPLGGGLTFSQMPERGRGATDFTKAAS